MHAWPVRSMPTALCVRLGRLLHRTSHDMEFSSYAQRHACSTSNRPRAGLTSRHLFFLVITTFELRSCTLLKQHIYTGTHTHLQTHMRAHTHTHTCIHTHTHMHSHTHTHIHTHTHTHTCGPPEVAGTARAHTLHTHARAHTHTYTHTSTHIHMHTHTHTHTCTHVYRRASRRGWYSA